MKKLNTLTALLFMHLAFISFSQLKVQTNGNIQIGPTSLPSSGYDFEIIEKSKSTEALIYAQSQDVARLWTANQNWGYGFGINNSNLGHIWGNINSPGYLMVWDRYGKFSMGFSAPNSSYRLSLNGGLLCQFTSIYSDKRLKNNIINLEGVSSKIYNLHGVSYTMKDSEEYKFDSQKEHYGFIAQDVQEIFPNLVSEDDNGVLSVDYIGMIPLLVEELKAQRLQIETLEKEALKVYSEQDAITKIDAILFQNSPNPFSIQSEIKYQINSEFANGEIMVFDMQGTLMKTYPLRDGSEGAILIDGNSFDPGMYLYSLIIDGQEYDTKRMILTK